MDMKIRLFLRLSLLAVLLVSCIPATTPVSPELKATAIINASATVPVPTQPTLETATETIPVLPTETLAPTPLPVATSRGPNLEATDPNTVSLASGQIQFVEFFRFT